MEAASTAQRQPPGLVSAVFGTGLVYLSLRKIGSIGDSDVWWHLTTGDLIRARRVVPSTDPFSWSAAGEPWQPNAWLSDVLFSWLREVGGLTALSILRSATIIVTGLLLWAVLRRRRARRWASVAAVFLGVLLMMPFTTERPQLIGFVAFASLMLILPAALNGSKAALVGTGVLLAWWANLHGSFIVGVGVVGLTALGWYIAGRGWRLPLVLVLVALLAPLLNPYGPGAYRQALSIPGVSTFIEEWRGFRLSDARDLMIAVFTLVAVLGIWRRGRWKSWDRSLPLLALVVLTARAIRTAPFLLMWGVPSFAAALSTVEVPRLRSWAAQRSQPLALGLLLAGVILAGSMLPEVGQAGSIDTGRVPVAQVDVLPDGCVLLNEYEFGGVVIDRRWPGILVSQDGRNDLYGLERIKLQESWLEDGDPRLLEAQGITCVLARPDRPLVDALRSDGSWRLLSESDLAVVFASSDS